MYVCVGLALVVYVYGPWYRVVGGESTAFCIPNPARTPTALPLTPTILPTRTALPQAIDLAFLHHSLSRTLRRGVSVDLLFAFEYTVQASTIVLTFVKYCL